MKRLLTAAAAVICAGVFGATAASAAPLAGTFEIGGGTGNPVRVGADWIDFSPFDTPDASGDGRFVVTGATGDFTGLTAGTIMDLVGLAVGSTIGVENWIEFDTQEAWNFTLTEIFPGAGDPSGCDSTVGGVPCTPPGSPFTLTNVRNQTGPIPPASSVSLTVSGFVLNELSERSVFSLTFTSQLDSLSAAGALNRIIEDEFVQSSWSAEGTVIPETSVPEPASMALMGLALSGMAVALRRRRQ